jgi:hypothetical protein
VNSCCDADIKGTATGTCVPASMSLPYIFPENKKWLCASASPTSWHECDANSVGKTLSDDGKSYTCLYQNGTYNWSEVVGMKDFMLALAIIFVLAVLVKKILRRKKKR